MIVQRATGWDGLLLLWLLPLTLACAAGSYLFYVQHNFSSMTLSDRRGWSFTGAAMHSSSYLRLGPVGRWFTANIGFHHVHHLSAAVPFYNLPKAMAAMPELQEPPTVTLSPGNIAASFGANVWDPSQARMVTYREANLALARSG